MRTLAEDTSPDAERGLIDLWRQATPAEKIAMAIEKTHALRKSMMAELRKSHPDETLTRLRRRFASLWLGDELAEKVYGSLSDVEQK